MNSYAADVIPTHFDLAGMKREPHCGALLCRSIPNERGRPDRTCRAIEGREVAVAKSLYDAAPAARHPRFHNLIEPIEQHPPTHVPDVVREPS
ncbi:MAG: hypothetical protein M3277_12635 [Actinomycetota bacterium]|nr:hypothetical protein [Actinomycetota bacterium]